MRRKCGALFMAAGAVLLAASLGFLIYNYADAKRAGEEAETVLTELYSLIEENNEKEKPEENGGVLLYDSSEKREEPAAEIDGSLYIGIVSVPSLGLELPVMKEWSYKGLRTAPCRYSGGVSTDDLVIAGHNYNSHFGRLKYVREGAEVVFTDINGKTTSYEADFIETLAPMAVEDMTSGDYPLTLFTCNYSGQARVALRCVYK